MAQYIKSVLIILFTGALVLLFLTMGLAILAAMAIALPIAYWWYRWRLGRKLDAMNKKSGQRHAKVIDVEYEIVDERKK